MKTEILSPQLPSLFRLALFCTFAAAGCARIEIDSFTDPQADVRPLTRWAWSSEAGKGPLDVEFPGPEYDEIIRDGVASALAAKGYAAANPAEAEFLVSYHALAVEKTSSSPVNETAGYASDWFSQSPDSAPGPADSGGEWAGEYTEGRLIVDAKIVASGILAWRATATTDLVYARPTQRQRDRLAKAVRLVMERFPARP